MNSPYPHVTPGCRLLVIVRRPVFYDGRVCMISPVAGAAALAQGQRDGGGCAIQNKAAKLVLIEITHRLASDPEKGSVAFLGKR
ncbi:hypothetical protein SAMN05216525_102142 [Bradyrhizobium sp. Gha]|nr:hypothetical protein SAMN05216525_102142 [Bradyrhizobium sp. Gha]